VAHHTCVSAAESSGPLSGTVGPVGRSMHHTDALPRPEDLIVEGPRTPDYAADGGERVQRAGTCVLALYAPLYVSPCMRLSMRFPPPPPLISLSAPSPSLVLLFPLPVFDTCIADWPDRKLLEGTSNGESIETALGLDSAMATMQRYIECTNIDLIRKIQVLFWDVFRHLACMYQSLQACRLL